MLPAGKIRSFDMNLAVTPDWPTQEKLELRVELNGVKGLQTGLTIMVLPEAPAAPAAPAPAVSTLPAK